MCRLDPRLSSRKRCVADFNVCRKFELDGGIENGGQCLSNVTFFRSDQLERVINARHCRWSHMVKVPFALSESQRKQVLPVSIVSRS